VDVNGHIGGALAGLFWGMAFFPRAPHPSGLKMRFYGMVFLGLFFTLNFVLFYTVV